jgi:hypothetical protein
LHKADVGKLKVNWKTVHKIFAQSEALVRRDGRGWKRFRFGYAVALEEDVEVEA